MHLQMGDRSEWLCSSRDVCEGFSNGDVSYQQHWSLALDAKISKQIVDYKWWRIEYGNPEALKLNKMCHFHTSGIWEVFLRSTEVIRNLQIKMKFIDNATVHVCMCVWITEYSLAATKVQGTVSNESWDSTPSYSTALMS